MSRRPALTVLVAPSGFKENLSAESVACHLARGVQQAMPDAEVLTAPLADGGEGFTQALVQATQGRLIPVRVTGPLGDSLPSFFGLLGNRHRTAVIEMAAAAGLRLVPRERRNPMLTTSRGVGELIRAALDAGAERILLGCGDSGVNDGGAGMAQALGARLLDAQGRELGPGGGELARLHRIDLSGLDPRLQQVQLDAAVNWHNVLLGPRGVARVFGPQKGATPAQVDQLDLAMTRWAEVIHRDLGQAIGQAPGAGASGGLGAGVAALLGGRLHPRFDIVMNDLQLDELLDRADLVITAEGSLDAQTPYGKVPAEVARRAKLRGLPVIALAGTLGPGADLNLAHGIDACASIVPGPCSLDEAMARSPHWLERAAADALRMVRIGLDLGQAVGAPGLRPRSRPSVMGQSIPS
ncbi:glycerate kinase [Comamonas serinivorans]|uniref:Glycerate kinase n=1 Tax=Comamonas serinivorans TaxID=1082851 RepID=A0A1Y0EK45_9BURK|nr:glycerate kinase [Comamonas serinivorans]ARU03801.1 glycerate kinase [Comamonas serinivorans]